MNQFHCLSRQLLSLSHPLMDLLSSVLSFVAPPDSMLMLPFALPTLFFLRLLEWLLRYPLMGLLNSVMDFVAPPASMLLLAFVWPSLSFLRLVEWLFLSYTCENMEEKVVVICGASSAIGEQIAYEYARRRANLVLVARREQRLHGIRENAKLLGAKIVLVITADVVKEEECRKFIDDTISYFGHLDHLVNTANLGHDFFFEEATDTSIFPHIMDVNFWGNVYPTYVALPHLRESQGRIVVNASVESWLPMPRMSIFAAAKAAVMNFYETLRFEVKEVGITIATHGQIGSDMGRGRIMLEEGAEIQWKEETEVHHQGEQIEEFAKSIVEGACRGDDYVKHPRWYDIFLIYKVFVPNVLGWAFHVFLVGGPGQLLFEATQLLALPEHLTSHQALPKFPERFALQQALSKPLKVSASPVSAVQY